MSERAMQEVIEQVENIYSKERLADKIESTIRNIADMQQAIQRCQKFLSHAYYQKQLLEEITYSYQVYWLRRKCSGSPVYYFLGVYRIPNIPNGEKFRDTIEYKRFRGKERKEAREYVEKLCKKYNYKLEDVANRR